MLRKRLRDASAVSVPEPTAGIVLFVILVGGAALRLISLGEVPLSSDEAFSWMTTKLGWNVLLWVPFDVHPPLYYLVQKLALPLGEGEAALRLPAAVFGIVTLGLVYMLGRAIAGSIAGLAAAASMALSTAHIHYSQEARSYTLLVLLIAVSTLCTVRSIQKSCSVGTSVPTLWPELTVYGLSALLALYTHTAAAFYVAALGSSAIAVAGYRRDWPAVWAWLVVNIVVCLLWTPWLLNSLASADSFDTFRVLTLGELGWHVSNAIGAPASPLGKVATIVVLVVVLAGTVLLTLRRGADAAPFVALLTVAPAAMLAAAVITPVVETRTLLPMALAAAVAFGALVAWLPTVYLRLAVAGTVLLLLASSEQAARPTRAKVDDASAMIGYIQARDDGSGVVVMCWPFSGSAFDYYAPAMDVYFVAAREEGSPVMLRYSPEFWLERFSHPIRKTRVGVWPQEWVQHLSTRIDGFFAGTADEFIARQTRVWFVAMLCSPEQRHSFVDYMLRRQWTQAAIWQPRDSRPKPAFLYSNWSELHEFRRN